MRSRSLLGAACLSAAFASFAAGQDSTKTLFENLPVRPFIAVGPGIMPYLDERSSRAGAEQAKLMLTLRKYPQWSFGVTTTAVMGGDTTTYDAPGFKPRLNSHAGALEVQRRWKHTAVLHPIATLAVGRILNAYYYTELVDGRLRQREPETTEVGFVQLAGGGEMNVTRWLRGTALLGYRTGGRMTISEAKGENGGVTFFLNLAFGGF